MLIRPARERAGYTGPSPPWRAEQAACAAFVRVAGAFRLTVG
ncbi:MAG TPA: hypothetical protein VFT66_17190 [Roseiflexaceae bacterium]|nr:hypothetical protein [Roseiflexaceae bacterium]